MKREVKYADWLIALVNIKDTDIKRGDIVQVVSVYENGKFNAYNDSKGKIAAFSKDAIGTVFDFVDMVENCEKETYDFVNPTHYKQNGVEVIEMMEMIWGVEKLIAHCEMNSFKYRMRLGLKPDQPIDRDLEKARWYENKANELRKKC